jgi:hypothetical protein
MAAAKVLQSRAVAMKQRVAWMMASVIDWLGQAMTARRTTGMLNMSFSSRPV